MSLLYQKARLLGRMFRAVDFADGSGSIGGGAGELAGDAAGSGWGGSSGGKPGESNMAQAGARGLVGPGYNIDGMTNRERSDLGFGAVEGFNPNNPTQTVDQMINSENVGKALEWGAPMALSAFAPGWGTAMLAGKSFGRLMNGTPFQEVVSDAAKAVLPGYINGQINKATGGLLGQATMAGNVLNSMTGSPQVPNIGREVVSGLMGSGQASSGGMGTAAPGTTMAGEGNGDPGAPQGTQTAQAAQPAQPAPAPAQDFNFASLGIDSAGWTSATKNYLEKRNGMV